MKWTVGYFRVSTSDQKTDSQQHEIRSYVSAKGLMLDKEYHDLGISGAKAQRPGLDELLRDVRQGKIKTVIIYSLSRLGRSLKNLLNILEEFETCSVVLISLREGWDLSTPTGRMIYQILGALSEWEREQIRERVRSGLQAARAKGKKLGRPHKKDVDVNQFKTLISEGLTINAVAKKMGLATTSAYRISKYITV